MCIHVTDWEGQLQRAHSQHPAPPRLQRVLLKGAREVRLRRLRERASEVGLICLFSVLSTKHYNICHLINTIKDTRKVISDKFSLCKFRGMYCSFKIVILSLFVTLQCQCPKARMKSGRIPRPGPPSCATPTPCPRTCPPAPSRRRDF